ncbi:hypothetical protein DM02DRAFT_519845, partial [Periconia macrospinosa]
NIKPGAKLPNAKLRPVPPHQMQAVKDHLHELQEKGFIEPCRSPMRSNLLIVAKPGCGTRICTDYQELNRPLSSYPC